MNTTPYSRSFILGVLLYFCMTSYVSASALQVASSVTLEDGVEVVEGMVVVGDDEAQTYGLSKSASDPQVFGVTAAKPSLVFVTDGHQVPVVTEGIALIRVSTSNGSIARGDVLTTASTVGVAMRAGEGEQNVFAIALEAYAQEETEIGTIQAEIGVDRARAALALAEDTVLTDQKESSIAPTLIRGVIATVLAVGGLFFVLYSFRSTIAHGVVSIGRNPRARKSIMTLSVANIIFAMLLCAVVLFIAVAVLILPL